MSERLRPNEEQKKLSRRELLKNLVRKTKDEAKGLAETIQESTLYSLAAQITVNNWDSQHTNIKLGDVTSDDQQRKLDDPARALWNGCVVAPILEETAFRALPNLLKKEVQGGKWRIGLPTSVLFALGHLWDRSGYPVAEIDSPLVDITVYGGIKPHIPLFEFGFGLMAWKNIRQKGYIHSVVAHSVVNLVSIGYLLVTKSRT